MSVNEEDKNDKIAIVGMAGIFPKAPDLNAYWHNITHKVDAITSIPETHWAVRDYFTENPDKPDYLNVTKGGFLPSIKFNPLEFGISPNNMTAIDTAQLFALITAKHALISAGYGIDRDYDRARVSVIYGVTGAQELVIPLGARLGHPYWRKALRKNGVAEDKTEQIISDIASSYVPWQEASFPGLLGNVVAGRIANRFNFGGSNCVADAACASSLAALHLACLELRANHCDMVVSGGVDTFNDPFMYACFAEVKALAPDGKSKPYDTHADGTSLGEGVGTLILKRYRDAVRDDDPIFALITNIGTASDGRGHAIYEPSVDGQIRAIKNCYRDVEPCTVELLEGHGTGTKVGDQVELQALTEVFRSAHGKKKWCALGSVKSQIGHTKAAAGIAGILKAVLALHQRVLPPTINCHSPHELVADPASPFYVNTETRSWSVSPSASHPRRAGVSSFGFGGSNYHCLLEESSANSPFPSPVVDETQSFSVTISGANAKVGSKTIDLRGTSTDNSARTSAQSVIFNHLDERPVMPKDTMDKDTMHEDKSEGTQDLAPEEEHVLVAGLGVLRKLQEQTAQLHTHFLEGQKLSLQTLNKILDIHAQNPTAETISSASSIKQSLPEDAPQIEETKQQQTVPPVAEKAEKAEIPQVKIDVSLPSTETKQETTSIANGLDASTSLQDSITAVVAEKTGYPQEMIKLNMKIEEDLGIDSIKRVEILSALKEKHPDLQTTDESLITAESLNDIVNFWNSEKKK